MKKNILLRIFAAVFAVMMVFFFTACGEEKKSEEKYRTDIAASMSEISSVQNELNDSIKIFFSSVTEENRKSVLLAVEDMSTAYGKIQKINAPEKYKETQKILSDSAKTALEAAAIYKKEFTEVTQKSFNEEFIKKISKGEDLLKKANSKFLEESKQYLFNSSES